MIVSYSIFNVLRISNHLYFKYTHIRYILEQRLTKSVNSFEISIIKTKANISYLFVKQMVLLSYKTDTYNIERKLKWNILPKHENIFQLPQS